MCEVLESREGGCCDKHGYVVLVRIVGLFGTWIWKILEVREPFCTHLGGDKEKARDGSLARDTGEFPQKLYPGWSCDIFSIKNPWKIRC